MAKRESSGLRSTLGFVAWLTGVLVSLAVAFGMIDGILAIRWIPAGITVLFGWIVVITTILGVVLAIAHKFQ